MFQACVVVNTKTSGMFSEPRRMENLPSSHLVCRARLAQRRPCALMFPSLVLALWIIVSRLCLFLELGTRRWTTVLHLHHRQHRGFVLVQFLHPHSFFVDDSQRSHALKRVSDSNDGRKFQNDYPFEVYKHLHHPLRRSCHVPGINMQVQSGFKITRVKNCRGLQTLFERSWAILRQQCVNEVILPSSHSFASTLSLTFKHCHSTC